MGTNHAALLQSCNESYLNLRIKSLSAISILFIQLDNLAFNIQIYPWFSNISNDFSDKMYFVGIRGIAQKEWQLMFQSTLLRETRQLSFSKN